MIRGGEQRSCCRIPGRLRPSWISAASLTGVVLIAFTSYVPASAAAKGEDAGEAIVVAGAGETRGLSGGGSKTEFSIRLPDGASCPGDSRNDGYRIQSFMVPAGVDLSTLLYRSVRPEGEGRYPLYDVHTTPYVQVQTADADESGQPGLIVNIPAFSYSVFPPGALAEGRYHVGIACTLINETIRYWDAEVEVVTAPDDKPAEIRWSVPGFSDDQGSGTPWVIPVGAVAISTVALVAIRRGRRNQQAV